MTEILVIDTEPPYPFSAETERTSYMRVVRNATGSIVDIQQAWQVHVYTSRTESHLELEWKTVDSVSESDIGEHS